MDRLILLLVFLLPLSAKSETLCPAQINILESIDRSPGSFLVFLKDGGGPRPLTGVNFFIGEPKNSGILEADTSTSTETKWEFLPNENIWIDCIYRDTALTLTHKLRAKTTNCTIGPVDPYQGVLFGQRLVSSLRCW
jgi:hypothetical protein